MIKARDEWTTVYGGPGNSLNEPISESFIFPSYWQKKNEIRKDKIKKIFDGDRKK